MFIKLPTAVRLLLQMCGLHNTHLHINIISQLLKIKKAASTKHVREARQLEVREIEIIYHM